jgi:hypothetical protein
MSISRINPPKFGGGLKFEPDEEIGRKGKFSKDFMKGFQVYSITCSPFLMHFIISKIPL